MIGSWLLPVVSAGLFGSAHCIGMCGGLLAVASDGSSGARARLRVQLSYQGARLLSYVTLGALAGSLGRALDLAGQAAGWGKAAAVVAGVAMTLGGLAAMLDAVGAGLRLPRLRLMPRFVTEFLGRARSKPPVLRAALLGGSSALLPCGFLYAFALAGAATGSPWGGALVMAALWLGNLPALLGFGLLLSSALSRLKRHIPLLSAATVFVLGVLTLNDRVHLPAFAAQTLSPPGAHHAAAPLPMPSDCPCHRKHAR
ncbi:MAG TPA: sulfite exporter TauE/SafE family protein [Polyangiaceae bacterium]|nr:sulfite exporter TauE/SafE family protein [Polyangiaceae bacterium]